MSNIHGYNSNSDEKQSFMLLGQKELEIEVATDEGEIKKENLSFEISFRFYLNETNKQTDNFEFIFKDVTISKIVDERNLVFKLKSLVLSKVAHEFKNPLICIIELIDQIYDEIEVSKLCKENNSRRNSLKSLSSFKNLINSNLPMIKSLSDYLLIFSQRS